MAKQRRLNRERVIARAVEMADQAGRADAVTLTRLAEALDVRTPSLYNHVGGLDDLYRGMAGHALARLLARLRVAVEGQEGRETLHAIAVAYRAFARDHPGTYPLTLRAPDAGDEQLQTLSRELVQLLLLVLATLGLTGDSALHAVRGFRALLHGFVALEAAEAFKLPLDPDQSFARALAAYLDGLVPDASSP